MLAEEFPTPFIICMRSAWPPTRSSAPFGEPAGAGPWTHDPGTVPVACGWPPEAAGLRRGISSSGGGPIGSAGLCTKTPGRREAEEDNSDWAPGFGKYLLMFPISCAKPGAGDGSNPKAHQGPPLLATT